MDEEPARANFSRPPRDIRRVEMGPVCFRKEGREPVTEDRPLWDAYLKTAKGSPEARELLKRILKAKEGN